MEQKSGLGERMNGYVAKSDVLNVIRILQSKMDDSGARALENVISAVEDMVEADVVPVVRCKDCKYLRRAANYKLFKSGYYCERCRTQSSDIDVLDWFCADGEAKE